LRQSVQMPKTSRNLLHVIGGEFLLRLANVAVAVLIGRVYGPALLGVYAAIVAVATLVERFADNGLEMAGIAVASRRPENLGRIGTALYVNKTVLSLIAIAALAGIAWATGFLRDHLLIACILTLRTFLYSYCRLNAGLLKAVGRSPYISRIQIVHFLILSGAILFSFLRGKDLVFLLLSLLTAQFVEFTLAGLALRSCGFSFELVSREFCWNLASRSTPIGLIYTLSTLMLRADVLILSLVATAAVVGVFAAANAGLVVVYVVGWLFSGVLLADLGPLVGNATVFNAHFRKCVKAIVLVCVPLAAAAMLLSPPAIILIYGLDFSAAALPAAIMFAAVPFVLLNAAFLSRAIARDAVSICLAIYGAAAAFSLALNFVLGWRYAGKGIAISILLREIAITFAFLGAKRLPSTATSSTMRINTTHELVEVQDV
jgi:O-antigen/teichoic acid export membrane protein